MVRQFIQKETTAIAQNFGKTQSKNTILRWNKIAHKAKDLQVKNYEIRVYVKRLLGIG